jgi:hypothetical protein
MPYGIPFVQPQFFRPRETGGGGGGDPYFSSVVLLLHCDGTDGSISFPDSSLGNNAVTAGGDVQVDTAQFKFGTASALFDGTGDYLTAPTGANFQFAADYTVEFWFRFNSVVNSNLFDGRLSTADSAGFAIFVSASTLRMYTANMTRITGATTLSSGQWYHAALSRDGSNNRLFLNGIQQGATYSSSANFSSGGCVIGAGFNISTFFNGWMDDIRITKGVARYTSNFTAPTAAFPNF